jgi:hypothetical protein
MRSKIQDSDVRNKLIVLVSILLALLVVMVCIVDIIIIRRRMAAQPTLEAQIVQPATAIPQSIPTMGPTVIFIPTAENTQTPIPEIVTVPPPPVWRFLRINQDNIGTFENVSDPGQKLEAKCIDPNRPPPNEGALYNLDGSGILKPQDGGKKYQRFKLISGQ